MFESLLATQSGPPLPPKFTLDIIPASEFITGAALHAAVGIPANWGTLINTNTDWFKFTEIETGIVRVIPKLAIRHSVARSWYITYTPDNESKRVTIQGEQYKVRLLRGATSDIQPIPLVANREYNELYYSVCSERPVGWTGHKLANFTSEELGFKGATGYSTWCHERQSTGTNVYIFRGNASKDFKAINANTYTNSGTPLGWRPILIKV